MTLQVREVRPVRLLPLVCYEDYGDMPPEATQLTNSVACACPFG